MDQNNTNDDLNRLREGDESARDRLIARAHKRLHRLASQMLKSYPGVKRWEQTDDILHKSLIRLIGAIKGGAIPESALHFYRLATLQIRRELLDLAKHYSGPNGLGANHETDNHAASGSGGFLANQPCNSGEPSSMEAWYTFHKAVESLPVEEREIVELIWYQGLTQKETAKTLEISIRTVRRRWQTARLNLAQILDGERPS